MKVGDAALWGFTAWGCYAIVGLALAFFQLSRVGLTTDHSLRA